MVEMGDWLCRNQVKLGHLSYLGASREIWFKFEMASLFMDKWERVFNASWNSYHLWCEAEMVDLAIAPEKESNGEVVWNKGGIMEFKTETIELRGERKVDKAAIGRLVQNVENDYEKRRGDKEFKPSEYAAITFTDHPLVDGIEDISEEVVELMEESLAELKDTMAKKDFHLPRKSTKPPFVRSSFRGEKYGFYSCGFWLKK